MRAYDRVLTRRKQDSVNSSALINDGTKLSALVEAVEQVMLRLSLFVERLPFALLSYTATF
ncbi:hypothetical protein DYU11_09955 [Fibrisoma montanum]|uniref:Uncharacterized protein n=1 Tax=Fibrisoma montanum TaxID=2305895 RepID=A0A418MAD8_9BACT|nr:hypothetical protein DYU11_09955 [Fibrisoma montanum]